MSAQKGTTSAPRKLPKNVTIHMACVVLSRNADVVIPEQKLWLDVILQAVRECKTKSHEQGCHSFFKSRSFSLICDLVGINVEFARTVIKKIGAPIDSQIIDACYK